MASTSAMFTGLTSLNAHSRQLEVIGNNIANVNTTAYKSNRLNFQTQFYNTLSIGSEPSAELGGTNPRQIGTGVGVAGTQANFSIGALTPTGDARDLAIDGNGFFVVDRSGSRLFTRDGGFRTNLRDELVTVNGDRLLGYGVDDRFQVVEGGALQPLTIPVGRLTIAEATQNALTFGNLDAGGQAAISASTISLAGSGSVGLRAISTSPVGAGNQIELTTPLVQIEDPELPASDTPLFAVGQTLQVTEASRGGKQVRDAELEITAATTLGDLNTFLSSALGIQTTGQANPDGTTPGVALDPATGLITVTGNTGSVNDLAIAAENLRVVDDTGNLVRLPFTPTQVANSDGESVRTTMVVFDSLGNAVDVDVTMVLEDKPDTGGTVWRYYADSAGDTDASTALSNGVLTFDAFGQLVSPESVSLTIDRTGTGAATPLQFALEFAGDSGRLTALADDPSTIRGLALDGLPTGTLEGYAIGPDGTIFGAFSNSATRELGRVAVASFINEEGLVQEVNNLFSAGPNSGQAVFVTPGELGTGRVVSGSLEQSNVDLGREFINMILTSTGYSAASRVISTSDELLQQLLVIGR